MSRHRHQARASVVAGVAAATLVFPALAAAAPAHPAHSGATPGHARSFTVLGAVASSAPVTVAVAMPLRHRAELNRLVAAQARRGSASYHKWLTPQTFRARYGVTNAEVRRLAERAPRTAPRRGIGRCPGSLGHRQRRRHRTCIRHHVPERPLGRPCAHREFIDHDRAARPCRGRRHADRHPARHPDDQCRAPGQPLRRVRAVLVRRPQAGLPVPRLRHAGEQQGHRRRPDDRHRDGDPAGPEGHRGVLLARTPHATDGLDPQGRRRCAVRSEQQLLVRGEPRRAAVRRDGTQGAHRGLQPSRPQRLVGVRGLRGARRGQHRRHRKLVVR